ncbi:MAG: hypothetical protein V7643_3062 [Mycobacterium sp.]|jgi:hypothetical protein
MDALVSHDGDSVAFALLQTSYGSLLIATSCDRCGNRTSSVVLTANSRIGSQTMEWRHSRLPLPYR